ncbi:MAG TPA: fluoride efflux transporter CrcB [Xanthomonadales bacterium]|nr:fluoride efflux transporter CrcB [Xanthomonadales bacterium]
MNGILIVGLGGFIGAAARHLMGGWVLHHTLQERFPFSTFAVNVLGCLVAGVLAGGVERYDWFTPQTRLFLFTGILGGFTTFSAFGIDAMFLLRRSEPWVAAAYLGGTVAAGVLAVWLGMRAVALLGR